MKAKGLLLSLFCACCAPLSPGEQEPEAPTLFEQDREAFPQEMRGLLPSYNGENFRAQYVAPQESSTFFFDVPENTLAVTLVLTDFVSTRELKVVGVQDARAARLLETNVAPLGAAFKHVTQLPNDLGGLAPGVLEVEIEGGASTHVFALFRVKEVPEKGYVNLVFVIDESANLDDDEAEEIVSLWRAPLSNALANAAIEVRDLDIARASLRLSSPLALGGEDCRIAHEDLVALEALEIRDDAIAVVVMSAFDCRYAEGQNTALATVGLATRIPSMPGGKDALFVRARSSLSDAESGILVAHELGHFLGLYHTQEMNGSVDAIDDTASGDDEYLMFNRVNIRSEKISPTQAKVMRASPWVFGD